MHRTEDKVEQIFLMPKKKYGQYNDLEILQYLLPQNRVKLVVFGNGNLAKWCIDWLDNVYHIVPSYEVCFELNEEYNGIKQILFEDWIIPAEENVFMIVADERYGEIEFKEQLIKTMKKKKVVTLFNALNIAKPYWTDWYVFIKEHATLFDESYLLFDDQISKQTFIDYLKVYITGDRYSGIVYPEEYKYWGKENKEDCLFELTDQETVLNVGGACGDTVFQYLKNEFPFQKIISVESDPIQYEYVSRSIALLPDEVRKKIQVDNIYIGKEEDGVDAIYKDERISLIEMDIEGAELDALEGAIETIEMNRPVLAICVYHRMDDLITIPAFMKQHLTDYTFLLRKYPSCYYETLQNLQQVNELVLYAIPNERYKKYER